MADREYNPAHVETLTKLQDVFEQLGRRSPRFTAHFLNSGRFVELYEDYAKFALQAVCHAQVEWGMSLGSTRCAFENAPEYLAETGQVLDEFSSILIRYPLLRDVALPEWATLFYQGLHEWDHVGLFAAWVGLERPEMDIAVGKRVIAAIPPQPSNERYWTLVDKLDEQSEFPLDTKLATPDTKDQLQFLAETPVTIISLYGVFDACAKMTRTLIAKLQPDTSAEGILRLIRSAGYEVTVTPEPRILIRATLLPTADAQAQRFEVSGRLGLFWAAAELAAMVGCSLPEQPPTH